MDRTNGEKISKEIEDLNNTINQLDVTDIYRTLYLTTTKNLKILCIKIFYKQSRKATQDGRKYLQLYI